MKDRILSIDLFRGLVMFLLVGESTELYHFFRESDMGFIHFLGTRLDHHEWHGLYFWDLIQPYFMFVAGVSIPFAVASRRQKGESDSLILKHAISRAIILLLLGWGLYVIGSGRLVWRFQNVLAQLSFTYLVSFLIKDLKLIYQGIISVFILVLYEIIYRNFSIEGYHQPWELYHNFGAWFNNWIEGEINSTEWASFNFLSTTAHTIWGMMVGYILIKETEGMLKIKSLLIGGIICLIVGYGLDMSGTTPIIKKIATTSFVLVSGGYSILTMLIFYYLFDIKKYPFKLGKWFLYYSKNSLFIYLFFHLGGSHWIFKNLEVFPQIILGNSINVGIITSILTWVVLSVFCKFLDKKKIYLKI